MPFADGVHCDVHAETSKSVLRFQVLGCVRPPWLLFGTRVLQRQRLVQLARFASACRLFDSTERLFSVTSDEVCRDREGGSMHRLRLCNKRHFHTGVFEVHFFLKCSAVAAEVAQARPWAGHGCSTSHPKRCCTRSTFAVP